ncbi:MAG TPA: hypothetical protein VN495_02105 [Candidatus Paceibacterota bacterium]|nr:hypothetical protein [Candidatus Paceibacterota bacterium]
MKERFEMPRKTESAEKQDAAASLRMRAHYSPTYWMALAAALTLSNPTPAESSEVTYGMTWTQGLDGLHDDVRNAESERAAEFVVKKDGTAFWIGSNAGEKTEVVHDPATKRSQAEAIKNGEIQTVCSFHTHPLHSAEAAHMITAETAQRLSEVETTLSAPPSFIDIDGNATDVMVWRGVPNVVSAVMDPAGLWYYRTSKNSDYAERPELLAQLYKRDQLNTEWNDYLDSRLREMNPQQLDAIITEMGKEIATMDAMDRKELGFLLEERSRRFVIKILIGPLANTGNTVIPRLLLQTDQDRQLYSEWQHEANGPRHADFTELYDLIREYVHATESAPASDELYQRLQEAYLKNAGKVRFVPRDQIAQEPMCAGVDYKK